MVCQKRPTKETYSIFSPAASYVKKARERERERARERKREREKERKCV